MMTIAKTPPPPPPPPPPLLLFFLLLLLALLNLPTTVHAACECGFLMNGTNDYFTHILYNNFSYYRPTKIASTSPLFARDWDVQRWAREPRNWATPLPIVNKEDNIFIREGHLMLKQEAYSLNDVVFGKNVSVSSMVSKRTDFFHGSFRIDLALVGANGGSVVGFFWYKDDENEIDIEILSREFKPDQYMVHYTSHPALDLQGNLIKNATEIITFKGDNPTQYFARHRFDWTRSEIRFYQEQELVHTNIARVPETPGQVHLNLWADGGPWSGSPSTTDAYLLVKAITVYFNTTESEAGKDVRFNKRCQKAGGPSSKTICSDVDVERGPKKKPKNKPGLISGSASSSSSSSSSSTSGSANDTSTDNSGTYNVSGGEKAQFSSASTVTMAMSFKTYTTFYTICFWTISAVCLNYLTCRVLV